MKKFIIFLIIMTFSLFLYAKYVETNSLKVNEYSIKSEIIPESFNGFKIIHFSDLLQQNDNNAETLNTLADEINATKADLIIFTGDLIKGKLNSNKAEELTKILNSLNAKFYKYAILGDNDTKQSTEILEKAGFIILDDEKQLIYNESNTPILIGTGKYEQTNEDNYFKIGIIHEPDAYSDIKSDYNLVLAGHSLGGQIRLPFWGALLKNDGAKIYTDAHYSDKNGEMYVSNGIGNEKINLRLFNKPSFNIYRFYNK